MLRPTTARYSLKRRVRTGPRSAAVEGRLASAGEVSTRRFNAHQLSDHEAIRTRPRSPFMGELAGALILTRPQPQEWLEVKRSRDPLRPTIKRKASVGCAQTVAVGCFRKLGLCLFQDRSSDL